MPYLLGDVRREKGDRSREYEHKHDRHEKYEPAFADLDEASEILRKSSQKDREQRRREDEKDDVEREVEEREK
jgi:hypothetical protein